MKLQNQAQIVAGILVYGVIAWLLGVGGRASLLPTEEAVGAGGTVATVFGMVAFGFLLLAYIVWAQADFRYD